MARLTALDNSFLRVESPCAHMHVGWTSHLDLPGASDRLEVGRLRATLASRLHLVPRFRQRLAPAPFGLAEPLWVDDAAFDLTRHLHTGPRTVSHHALRGLADAFLSRPLARDRPLWSLLVFPRVEPRGAALVGKVHHALADGLAAVELGTLLFDSEPDSEPRPSPAWRPRSRPGAARQLVDITAGGVRSAAQGLAGLAVAPQEGLRRAESGGRAALALASDGLRAAPPSFINGDLTPARSLRVQRFEMHQLDEVKRVSGVKLNDVVLALAAGAVRQLALVCGEEPEDLRAMVPVSVRTAADGHAGNRIAFSFLRLPVAEQDPLARLRSIRSATLGLKRSGRVAGSDVLMRSVGRLPGLLQGPVARLASSPRMFNLTVSNVPGPPIPLYVAGARVNSIFPVTPLSQGHAIALGALSYDGGMHFAAHCDLQALPEAAEVPTFLGQSLADLVDATGLRAARGRAPPRAATPPVRAGPGSPQ